VADYFVGRIKAFPVNDREVGGFTGFFAFHLLQQKAEREPGKPGRSLPGPSAVCRLQSALGLRPRRALSSAGV